MTHSLDPYLGKGATNIPISNSEIQMFRENRREWWLRYYRGLAPKESSMVGPLPLGSRVHLALEALYKTGEDPLDVYRTQLLADTEIFEASLDAQDEAKVKKFHSDSELGRIMLEGYLEWLEETNEDARYEVIDVEKELTYPIFDGRVLLRGKIDLKVRDTWDGARLMLDHKTSASFTQFRKTAHMSEQLMMYTLLEKLQGDTSTPIEGGIYNLLKKVKRTGTAKPPFYERIVVRFNDKTLESFWIRLNGTVRDMLRVRDELDAGADPRYVAYPRISDDLTWKSSFFPVYHMFDDGSAAEQWLADFCEVSDPYARYDEKKDEG